MEIMQFDYIIIGAGSSGCVIAARLSEQRDCRVLILEAGSTDRNNLWIRIPLGVGKILPNQKLIWPFFTEPEAELHDKKISQLRGKVLGGSGSVNGLAWVRGEPKEFDRWRDWGNVGWGFDDLLPLYKKLEDYPHGDPAIRGQGGPMKIINRGIWDPDPLSDAYRQACIEAGIPANDDYNGRKFEGVGYLQQSIDNGRRCSAATAYLWPAASRHNLTVLTKAVATRVLFEGTRAIGVEFLHQGKRKQATAAQEVILSGGTYKSAHLLELSGIGNPALLQAFGIPVVAASPNVGENLSEHLQFRFSYECTKPITINDIMGSNLRRMYAGAQYMLTRRGLLSGTSSTVHALAKSHPSLESPDLKIQLALISGKDRLARTREAGIDPFSGFSIGTFKIRPESRGSSHLKDPDPLALPSIRINYLTHPGDIETYKRAVKIMRKIAAAPSLRPFIKRETRPGAVVQHDDELIDYIRDTGQTAWHAIGTCRMGVDENAVVDPRLRVKGVTHLRVADISIMPSLASPNTNAPAILIGEKAATMIKEDATQAITA
jgi:choline dehydrogenase